MVDGLFQPYMTDINGIVSGITMKEICRVLAPFWFAGLLVLGIILLVYNSYTLYRGY